MSRVEPDFEVPGPEGKGIGLAALEALVQRLRPLLKAMKEKYERRVAKVLLKERKCLGQMKRTEVRLLFFELEGLCRLPILLKVRLVACGEMPEYLIHNAAIPAERWVLFPAETKEQYRNNAAVLVHARGRLVPRTLASLDAQTTWRIIDTNHPEDGILPPEERNRRRLRKRCYLEIVALQPHPQVTGMGLLTCALGNRTAFVETSAEELRAYADELDNMNGVGQCAPAPKPKSKPSTKSKTERTAKARTGKVRPKPKSRAKAKSKAKTKAKTKTRSKTSSR